MSQNATKSSFPKYPAYKYSGVEWLGEIPEGWEVNRLKSIISLLTGYPFKSEKYSNTGVKLARGINVKEGYFDWTDKRCWPEVSKELEPFLLEEGDVLIAMDGSKVGKNFCQVKQTDLPTLLLQRVARLRTRNSLLPKYLYWNIVSKSFLSWVNISKTDPMVPHIAPKDINNFVIAIPSPSEQTAIAAFLDDKTAKIDRAIAQKEQLIALLKERKQIIIQNAVTKGLDPNVKLKDSGVESLPSGQAGIGEIPEHWEVVANRVLFKETKLPGREGLPLLSVSIHSAVSTEELSDEKNIRGLIKIDDKANYKYVAVNDIVFNMMRAWQGAIGAVKVEGMVSPAYVVAKPNKKIVASYFEYLYRTSAFIQQMNKYSKGITDFRKRLYWDEFKQLQTVLPLKSEQLEIVKIIETQSAKIDQAINLQRTQIEKLKEYKATLIDSAVTGKIKVI